MGYNFSHHATRGKHKMPKMTEEEKKHLKSILTGTPIVDSTEWEKEFEQGTAVHEKVGLIKTIWNTIVRKNDTEWIEKQISFLEQDFTGNLYASAFVNQDPKYLEAIKAIKESNIPLQHINTLIRAYQLSVADEILALQDGKTRLDNGANIAFYSQKVVDKEIGYDILPDKKLGQMLDDFYLFDPDYDED